ncbi:predicted protein [Plenodomus lingam JN3]|uniref:Predicted protein n=1 Tax=Leptosphaeria maculans (strain JN3 / isolate v23.1.3 / race Av1-4-5-6-7-8) TaxID=985895 RepID=E5AEH9_LEPMJ|nr:predicted protein [Plenodomus lingam JN3]CBY01618.1 predicted protein [Plenodomus lingam JN3]
MPQNTPLSPHIQFLLHPQNLLAVRRQRPPIMRCQLLEPALQMCKSFAQMGCGGVRVCMWEVV